MKKSRKINQLYMNGVKNLVAQASLLGITENRQPEHLADLVLALSEGIAMCSVPTETEEDQDALLATAAEFAHERAVVLRKEFQEFRAERMAAMGKGA